MDTGMSHAAERAIGVNLAVRMTMRNMNSGAKGNQYDAQNRQQSHVRLVRSRSVCLALDVLTLG